jgi:hypothetical protein
MDVKGGEESKHQEEVGFGKETKISEAVSVLRCGLPGVYILYFVAGGRDLGSLDF